MTIGEILKAEPLSVKVFQKYGLDHFQCICLEFEEACSRFSANPQLVKEELIHIKVCRKRLVEPLDQVVETILNHHSIVKNNILIIYKALQDAILHESEYWNDLLTIKTKFEMLAESLEIHLYKEEMILFPEFINLWSRQKYQTDYLLSFNLMYPIESLLSEHESTQTILNEIKELICYYRVPKNVGALYSTVCSELKVFEKNLVKLIHLEDTILFPEALALENDFHNNAKRH